MNHAGEDATLKTTCTQIILSLHQIDAKLLEQGVAKLDFTKKTPIRKVMIEYENQTAKGKNMQVISTFDNPGAAAAAAPVPTQGPNFVANA